MPVFAKIVMIFITIILIGLFGNPLNAAGFYFAVRPLVQPFAFLEYHISGIPITSVLPILLILISTANCFVRRKSTFFPPNIIPLYLWLFLSVLSFANSYSISLSIGAFLKIVLFPAVYLAIYNGIQTKKDANKILYCIVIASIIPMLFGYYQYATGTGHAWKAQLGYAPEGNRIDSLLGEYNSYGIFLCLTIIASLMLVLQERNKAKKLLLISIIVSLFVSLILSLNRGSWISLMAGFFVGYLFYIKKLKIRWVIIACLIILIFFSKMIIDRFSDIGHREHYSKENTLKGRIDYWEKIMPLIILHPFIGHGLGTSSLVTQKHLGNENVPHNDYLRISLETGIITIPIYIVFLLTEILKNFSLVRKKHNWFINFPMLVCCIYFTIISLTQNLISNVIVFPLFMGLIGVSRKWNRIEIENSPPAL